MKEIFFDGLYSTPLYKKGLKGTQNKPIWTTAHHFLGPILLPSLLYRKDYPLQQSEETTRQVLI